MAIGSGSPWKLTQTFESATSGVIKAAPGAVGAAIATNEHTADQYLQFFDSATAPAGGAVPKLWLKIPAGKSYTLSQVLWGDRGLAFQNGIAWGISSTRKTFTAGDSSIDIQIYWA